MRVVIWAECTPRLRPSKPRERAAEEVRKEPQLARKQRFSNDYAKSAPRRPDATVANLIH
jgi:hypothetical protein